MDHKILNNYTKAKRMKQRQLTYIKNVMYQHLQTKSWKSKQYI